MQTFMDTNTKADALEAFQYNLQQQQENSLNKAATALVNSSSRALVSILLVAWVHVKRLSCCSEVQACQVTTVLLGHQLWCRLLIAFEIWARVFVPTPNKLTKFDHRDCVLKWISQLVHKGTMLFAHKIFCQWVFCVNNELRREGERKQVRSAVLHAIDKIVNLQGNQVWMTEGPIKQANAMQDHLFFWNRCSYLLPLVIFLLGQWRQLALGLDMASGTLKLRARYRMATWRIAQRVSVLQMMHLAQQTLHVWRQLLLNESQICNFKHLSCAMMFTGKTASCADWMASWAFQVWKSVSFENHQREEQQGLRQARLFVNKERPLLDYVFWDRLIWIIFSNWFFLATGVGARQGWAVVRQNHNVLLWVPMHELPPSMTMYGHREQACHDRRSMGEGSMYSPTNLESRLSNVATFGRIQKPVQEPVVATTGQAQPCSIYGHCHLTRTFV